LAMMQRLFGGVEISAETLALDSIAEVGPGGHHFSTAHTLARYQGEFYLPILSDRRNIGLWQDLGAQDVAQRANHLWKDLLQGSQPPPIDAAVDAELHEYVARRTRELT